MRRLLAGCLLLLATASSHAAAVVTGVVFVVIDGDTVLFRPDHVDPASRAFLKVRLAAIDAPEQAQPHGEAATRALKAMLLNRRVSLRTVATDVYGRTLAHIQAGALEVNAELVRQGHAWVSTRNRTDAGLMAAQAEARQARRGLWQDAAPTPPWAWRRAQPVSVH